MEFRISLLAIVGLYSLCTFLSCKRGEKAEIIEDRLPGVYWFARSNLLSHGVSDGAMWYEEYKDDGNWRSINLCNNVCYIPEKGCRLCDQPCPRTDRTTPFMPYTLSGNILITQRHEKMHDTSTPLVTDSIKIKFIKKCFGRRASGMIMIPLNDNASKRLGVSINSEYRVHKFLYVWEHKRCKFDPACPYQ